MKSLSYLNKYFLKYKWRMLLGVLFIILSNYFGVKMPLFVQQTVDTLMKGNSVSNFNEAISFSLKVGGLYMLLSLGKGFFLFLTRQTIIITSRLIEFDLKNEIYNQYQRLSYTFYKKNNTGDLMNRISEDVSQVRMYLGPGVMYTINLAVLFTMIIREMVAINLELTLFVLLPLPLMSFLIYKVSSKMNALSAKVQKQQSGISTLVQEVFSGIRVIKAYTREKETINNFDDEVEVYKQKQMSLVTVNSLFMPTIIFLIGLSTVLSIYIGGKMTYNNEITLGQILAFIFFVNNLTWPFASVGWVTSVIQRAAASQERINEFLKVDPEIKNSNQSEFHFKGKIEFKNVSYTYPNSNIEAVRSLNFTIHPGETLGVVGSTGSGKTTIINLLMRQFDPHQGVILIDDQPLPEINLDVFRRTSAVVPQEVFLFSDTIGNNIKFGSLDTEISQERIESAARKAHVLHNIEEFPQKFDTILGERGVNLSGGQKQRVSISRALLRDADLLIFDDCFSAVDTETEEIILKNLKSEIKKKTSIVVSHRISSLRNADRIIVLDNHTITETGTHSELLALKGFYADMYERQLTEEN
ncbi:MAG: ABC transporter ATP-binding protein/permease [Bacteroidetes bacterium]|nr:ABC transporter ATP-binding protein/permease [Bacteroidota bacterium]